MKRFGSIIGVVMVCWVVFVLNNVFLGGSLTHYGIHPRHIGSLLGIIWSPFLHVSFGHLAANTLPLLILGAIICGRNKAEFLGVTATGILIGGGLTWLMARDANHVGASGLIFCYFGFLISRAWFDRTLVTFFLAAVCLVGYGGILIGLLPISSHTSWEGHLAGLVSGVAAAWLISNNGQATAPIEVTGFNKVG